MKYQMVVEKIVKDLPEMIPERYSNITFEAAEVNNNRGTYTAIVCKPEGGAVGFNIDASAILEHMYEDGNEPLYTEILEAVCDAFEKNIDRQLQELKKIETNPILSKIKDFAMIKDKLFVAPVSEAGRDSYDASCTKAFAGGTLLIPRIVAFNDANGGVGSIALNSRILAEWNVSLNEVFDVAFENVAKDMEIKSLSEVLIDMMGMDMAEDMLPPVNPDQELHVVTNKVKVNGGAAVFAPQVMERISNNIFNGSDVYIIPSSIHESLVVSVNAPLTAKDLNNMVREVNTTQVAPEDRMGNEALAYNAKTKTITSALEYEKNLNVEMVADRTVDAPVAI